MLKCGKVSKFDLEISCVEAKGIRGLRNFQDEIRLGNLEVRRRLREEFAHYFNGQIGERKNCGNREVKGGPRIESWAQN